MNNLFRIIQNIISRYRHSQKPTLLDNIFSGFVLVLSTYAVIPFLMVKSGVINDPVRCNAIMQVLWLGVFVITFFLLLFRLSKVVRIAFHDKWLWILVGLAFVSVVWSGVPLLTLRHSIALLGTTFFGVYLASRYSRQEILKLLVWTLGLIAVLSLGFALLLPQYGIQYENSKIAWRGVYFHKNLLGNFMVLTAITSLLYAFSCRGKRLVGLILFGISVALLFLSTSRTALVILLILLFLLSMIKILRGRYMRSISARILLILSVGSLAVWLTHNMDIIFNILGRDTTLTGRTFLWQAVLGMIHKRPWLGYGYNAFWLGEEGLSNSIWQSIHWRPDNAHNGYLDLWLQLGLLGVVFFAVSFITNLFKAITLVRRENGWVAMFPLLFLTCMLIHNITESTILFRNQIFWILYVLITVQLRSGYKKDVCNTTFIRERKYDENC